MEKAARSKGTGKERHVRRWFAAVETIFALMVSGFIQIQRIAPDCRLAVLLNLHDSMAAIGQRKEQHKSQRPEDKLSAHPDDRSEVHHDVRNHFLEHD